MRLALMPNPNHVEVGDFQMLGPMFDELTPDQRRRVEQVMMSWGFAKYGLPVSAVRSVIRKVRSNWP